MFAVNQDVHLFVRVQCERTGQNKNTVLETEREPLGVENKDVARRGKDQNGYTEEPATEAS